MERNIPEILAALAFFGAIFVCPIVYLLLKHQRAMAELIHRNASSEAHQRIELLEREMRDLKTARHEQIIQEDDRRELSRRIQ